MYFILTAFALLIFPELTLAGATLAEGGSGGDLSAAFTATAVFFESRVIPVLFAIGFTVLVWGIIKYFIVGGSNDDARESGRNLILSAIIGFVVILAFWGIINIFTSGIGLGGQSLNTVPQATQEIPAS